MCFIYMKCENEYCIEQWPYRNLEPDIFFYCNESYWLVPGTAI